MKAHIAVFTIFAIAVVAQGQSRESGLSCSYHGAAKTKYASFRANEYCSRSDEFFLSQITFYTNKLDDQYWERSWLEAVDQRGNVRLSTEYDLDPKVDIGLSYDFDSWRHEERRDLEAETEELIAQLAVRDGYLEDQALLDYLSGQLIEVHPNPMLPGRPGGFSILVLKSSLANAYAASDGTIIVTTGLLASLRNEQELKAILAHEVAHVVLDHQLESILKAESRQKLNAVLGPVAGALASVVVSQIASQRGASIGTLIMLNVGVDVGVRILTAEVLTHAGFAHSRSQEDLADDLAQLWLLDKGYEPTALMSALNRLDFHQDEETHRDKTTRLDRLTKTIRRASDRTLSKDVDALMMPSIKYDTGVTPALTMAAGFALSNGEFEAALSFIERINVVREPTGQELLMQAVALRETGQPPSLIFDVLDRAEESGDLPEGYVDIERALVFMVEQDDAGAYEAFTRIDLSNADRDSYPPALLDWIRQMRIVLK